MNKEEFVKRLLENGFVRDNRKKEECYIRLMSELLSVGINMQVCAYPGENEVRYFITECGQTTVSYNGFVTAHLN